MHKHSSMVLALGLVAAAGMAAAQERYPAKAVRMVVPFAPGGGADISARTIAAKLTERLGQQFVVENRAGGGGNVGTEYVAKAVPDGYTLLLVSSSYGANPSLYKLSFDPISGFEPITLVSQQPFIAVVHPSLRRNDTLVVSMLRASRKRVVCPMPRPTKPCAESVAPRNCTLPPADAPQAAVLMPSRVSRSACSSPDAQSVPPARVHCSSVSSRGAASSSKPLLVLGSKIAMVACSGSRSGVLYANCALKPG